MVSGEQGSLVKRPFVLGRIRLGRLRSADVKPGNRRLEMAHFLSDRFTPLYQGKLTKPDFSQLLAKVRLGSVGIIHLLPVPEAISLTYTDCLVCSIKVSIIKDNGFWVYSLEILTLPEEKTDFIFSLCGATNISSACYFLLPDC